MTPSGKRRPSYWIVLIPLLLGAGTCGGTLYSLAGKVESMPRVKVPGTGRIHLAAGEHVGFLETSSVIDGEAIKGTASVNCRINAAEGGALIPLEPVSGSTSYSFGSYAGESMVAVDIPHSGDYVIRCEGSGAGAIAFGKPFGWMIALAVVSGLLGVIVAGFLAWRVRRRRRVS